MERVEEEGGGKISHQRQISRQDKSGGEKSRGVRSHWGGGKKRGSMLEWRTRRLSQ